MPDLYTVTRTLILKGCVRADNGADAHNMAEAMSDDELTVWDKGETVERVVCKHVTTSMVNKVIQSGDWCPKCGMLYP
jgi:hypothetical protein